ncbi:MAG: YgiQ family radical SAM protein [Tepidisphaerales bacterium]
MISQPSPQSRPDVGTAGQRLRMPAVLPMSRAEMDRLGWKELDVLLVSGDAYVDHPSFGASLLGRWLVHHGYRVGIVAQPRWTTPEDILGMGRPRLFAGVTAGAMDSMLAHYTAFRKKRSDDAYTPGGRCGARPNRAAIVYAGLVKQAFPKLPIVLGGIEASLRRITHFDFWTDKLRRSILLDAKADLILYGMAERGILAVADRLREAAALADDGWARGDKNVPHSPIQKTDKNVCPTGLVMTDRNVCPTGIPTTDKNGCPTRLPMTDRNVCPTGLAMTDRDGRRTSLATTDKNVCPTGAGVLADPSIPGAVYIGEESALPAGAPVVQLPSHEEMLADPTRLMAATLAMEQHVHHASAFAVHRAEGKSLILTPPRPLEVAELDVLYTLPFTREPHPSYDKSIPAAEMIRFSITSHRGCAGGCSFCTLASHQGRTIHSRSRTSILDEAEAMAKHPRFTGSISDVGGPSANMWGGHCSDDPAHCHRASCLFPAVCTHFAVDQMRIVELLREVRKVRGVKHVRVASGIRHDLALKDREYIHALVREFVGGQLKIAPEHLSDEVLRLMRKPGPKAFEQFLDLFAGECQAAGKEQFVVPYLISAFPGCTTQHMQHLAQWLAKRGWQPQQVQCFIPLPGTVAAAMYYAGIDASGVAIPVARTDAQRLQMHYTLFPRGGKLVVPRSGGKLVVPPSGGKFAVPRSGGSSRRPKR